MWLLAAAGTGFGVTRAKGRQAHGIAVVLSLALFLAVVQFLPASNLDQARYFLTSPSP